MNYVIWKCELELRAVQQQPMPEGAEILFVHEQNDRICVWFRCIPDNTPVLRNIVIVGTGHQKAPPPEESKYLGTAVMDNGMFIWHVFECK